MTSSTHMHDVVGTPVAWVPQWVGPHEGGMTLAMKYAWVNALDGATAAKSICGRSLVQHHSPKLHGRTFLIPGWAAVSRVGEQSSIGAVIARRDISRYAGRCGEWLASDTHFRYCPDCIQLGYQSLLFQIDGLTFCPLHKATLLAACRRCNAPTPPYALTAETMANPFCCPACGAAYGEKFDPRGWKCAALHVQASEALLPLYKFLRRIGRANIEWLDWGEWFGPWLGEVDLREKRIATFFVLRRLVKHHLDDGLFASLPRSLSVSRGQRLLVQARSGDPSPLAAHARRQVYKSIRRHLLKQLPRTVSRRALLSPNSDEINLGDATFRLSLQKCPLLQAVWLWRLRFERQEAVVSFHSLQRKILELREDAQNWPWRGVGDDAVWGHSVLIGFHAAAEIVYDWWRRATALAHSSLDSAGSARLMELHMEFASLLSPARVSVPPRVTALLETRKSKQGVAALYVVGPGSGLEKILACANSGRPSLEPQ